MTTDNRVPLIRADLPSMDEIATDVAEALRSGQVTNFGSHVSSFEKEARDYLGVEVLTTSSGTAALILILQALGVAGHKVVLPSFTFVATAQAVLYAGATPVFCDVGADLTVSTDDLEKVLIDHGEEVAAVVPVHTYGTPCATSTIEELARQCGERTGNSISVVYDAAHAFGSAVGGRKIGSFGDAEVFSLSATKVLSSIEGGMVSSGNPAIIDRLRSMRNYGIGDNYESYWPGLNAKMSELHAIVGRRNLARLDELVQARSNVATAYSRRLEQQTSFQPIPVGEGVTHTFKDFTVLTPPSMTPRRDEVMAYLSERGIETRRYFWPPVHQHRFFSRFSDRELPVTEDLGRRVITLPFFTTMTDEQIDQVVTALVDAEKALS